jgi:hypothetical protein
MNHEKGRGREPQREASMSNPAEPGSSPPSPSQDDRLDGPDWNKPGAIEPDRGAVESAARRRKRRRRIAGAAGLAVTAVVALLAVPSLRNQLPANVPVVGNKADTVWAQIRDSGLAVGEGEPSATRFGDLVKHNSCKSSHSFVQSEGDTGWAIICVKPPRDAYRALRKTMNGIPALLAPIWVDQNHGEVIIFGMGWPGKASDQIAKAIGGDAEYVTFDTAAG